MMMMSGNVERLLRRGSVPTICCVSVVRQCTSRGRWSLGVSQWRNLRVSTCSMFACETSVYC